MKFGFRKPSIKKSIKTRTTGKIKRKAKKAINHLYGKKGMGFVKNPKNPAPRLNAPDTKLLFNTVSENFSNAAVALFWAASIDGKYAFAYFSWAVPADSAATAERRIASS